MTHELGRVGIDPLKLLSRGKAVLANRADVFADLGLEASHTDHVKFIKVVGGDRQKPEALQQRVARIFAFPQNPLVKSQPRDFPVEEPIGRTRQVLVQAEGKLGHFDSLRIHGGSDRHLNSNFPIGNVYLTAINS